MNLRTRQGTVQQVDETERQLLAEGYRQVQKSDEKTLLPGEYTKTYFEGSERSFDGPGGCTLRWSLKQGNR